jgi:hypothetical protein
VTDDTGIEVAPWDAPVVVNAWLLLAEDTRMVPEARAASSAFTGSDVIGVPVDNAVESDAIVGAITKLLLDDPFVT